MTTATDKGRAKLHLDGRDHQGAACRARPAGHQLRIAMSRRVEMSAECPYCAHAFYAYLNGLTTRGSVPRHMASAVCTIEAKIGLWQAGKEDSARR